MTGDATSGSWQRKVRHELSQQERDELARLLARVPQKKRTYTLWASREGQDFLDMDESLRDAGVPIRWMADALKLDERPLTQVLREKRDREIRRNSPKR